MTISLINFKLNSDNPDDSELLAFFDIAKTFGLTKTDICKLAIKRLVFDIASNQLQDGSFSPHFAKAILESDKITYLGRAGETKDTQESTPSPSLEITDKEISGPVDSIATQESVEVSPMMTDQLKNILGGK